MGILSRALRRRPKAAVADAFSAAPVTGTDGLTAAQRHFYASDTSRTPRERQYREEQLRRRVKSEHPGLEAIPVDQAFPGWRTEIGTFVIVDQHTREVVAGDDDGRSLNLHELEAWLSDPITDVEAAAARKKAGPGAGRAQVVKALVKDLRIDIGRQID